MTVEDGINRRDFWGTVISFGEFSVIVRIYLFRDCAVLGPSGSAFVGNGKLIAVDFLNSWHKISLYFRHLNCSICLTWQYSDPIESV